MQQRVMSRVLSFIEPLITAVLGRYIEGDIAKCLLFHRWGIEFKSENVKLKKGALDELGLPISIKRGFLKLLHITITYTFHIEVTVNGYFLLIGPQHSRKHFDTLSSKRQAEAIKRSLLNRAERRMLETEWKFLSSSMSYGELFVRGILKHFVRNIKVTISDVHVRYQDVTTIPHHSFVFGITIKHIRIRNKQEKEEQFGDEAHSEDGYGGGSRSRARTKSGVDEAPYQSNNFLDNYLISKLDDTSSSEDNVPDEPPQDDQAEGTMEDEITKQMSDAFDSDNEDAVGSNEHKTDDGSGASDPELDRKVITKEIEIEALSVYNDIAHDEQKGTDIIWREGTLSDEELDRRFQFIPSKQLRISSYNYILKPFSLRFDVFLHENFRGYIEKYPDEPHKWRPNLSCDVELDGIDIYVSTKQMFALHSWAQNMEFIRKKVKYHKLIQQMKEARPSVPATTPKGRRAWWFYLFQCAMKRNKHKQKKEVDLRHIINFEIRKNRYKHLYKRKMAPYKYRYWLQPLDSMEKEELNKIETNFPYSQILVFRCLAIAELRKEMEKRDEYQAELQRKKNAERSNSYFLTKMISRTMDLVSAPEENIDAYRLTKTERTVMMKETDFIQIIDQNMKYPDNYVEAHLGAFLDELNVQLKDDDNGDIALVQIGIGTQFDIRPNSYLSQIGLNKLDLCLGSKRNLKDGSLFKALLTPVTAQIDIETDSLDINKNHIRIHNVGLIELLLNPDIIQSNALKIERLAKNVTAIIERKMAENAVREESKDQGDDSDVNALVVAIEEDLEKLKVGGSVKEQYVVQRNDVLLVKSRKEGVLYFVSLQSINGSRDYPQTALVGYWVMLQTNSDVDGGDVGEYVFVRDDKNTMGGGVGDGVATIRLQNIMQNARSERKERGKYMRFGSKRQPQRGGWIITEKQDFLKHLKSVEQEKLYNAEMLE